MHDRRVFLNSRSNSVIIISPDSIDNHKEFKVYNTLIILATKVQGIFYSMSDILRSRKNQDMNRFWDGLFTFIFPFRNLSNEEQTDIGLSKHDSHIQIFPYRSPGLGIQTLQGIIDPGQDIPVIRKDPVGNGYLSMCVMHGEKLGNRYEW
jgi:hypothetical protein